MKTYTGNARDESEQNVIAKSQRDPKDARALSHYALPLRLDLANHSPTGFAWGYGGSGPAQLALAILADHFGDDAKALRLYQRFKFICIARFPQDEDLVLTSAQIDELIACDQVLAAAAKDPEGGVSC